MRSVAHVEPEHVRTRFEQRADGSIVVGGRPQGGHDLYIAKASHPASFPCRSIDVVVGRSLYGPKPAARQLALFFDAS
ncbi:hypothetical protein D516_1156 [Rhodobacter sp. AKP1]|nr:hypothetical protein D516_1156 [Rhodobacter sp. AKP1]